MTRTKHNNHWTRRHTWLFRPLDDPDQAWVRVVNAGTLFHAIAVLKAEFDDDWACVLHHTQTNPQTRIVTLDANDYDWEKPA